MDEDTDEMVSAPFGAVAERNQYRKKVKQAQKEVNLDENGVEVVKLKGPWHVCILAASARCHVNAVYRFVC